MGCTCLPEENQICCACCDYLQNVIDSNCDPCGTRTCGTDVENSAVECAKGIVIDLGGEFCVLNPIGRLVLCNSCADGCAAQFEQAALCAEGVCVPKALA